MDSQVDCKDLTMALVLSEMVNQGKQMGWGTMQKKGLSVEDAKVMLAQTLRFDYVRGVPVKIDFTPFPFLDGRLYERDSPISLQAIVDGLISAEPQVI